MKGFVEYETLRRLVKIWCRQDEIDISLLELCNTVLGMFSPDTIPEPESQESVIRPKL